MSGGREKKFVDHNVLLSYLIAVECIVQYLKNQVVHSTKVDGAAITK